MLHIINKIKTTCLCVGLLLLGGQAVAQDVDATQYHPYAPVGIPNGAPKWMERLTDVENVNYHAMVDSFEAFKHDHPEMRRKTPKIGRAHVLNSSHANISYAVFCLKKK